MVFVLLIFTSMYLNPLLPVFMVVKAKIVGQVGGVNASGQKDRSFASTSADDQRLLLG